MENQTNTNNMTDAARQPSNTAPEGLELAQDARNFTRVPYLGGVALMVERSSGFVNATDLTTQMLRVLRPTSAGLVQFALDEWLGADSTLALMDELDETADPTRDIGPDVYIHPALALHLMMWLVPTVSIDIARATGLGGTS